MLTLISNQWLAHPGGRICTMRASAPLRMVSSLNCQNFQLSPHREYHAAEVLQHPNPAHDTEPFNTLVKTFSFYGPLDYETFQPLIAHLKRMVVPEGLVLWKQGDEPDGLYVIESCILRASYRFAEHAPLAEESMVPGTLAGELSALSGLSRNATVVVDKQGVLWKLPLCDLRQLEAENPSLGKFFTELVLKCEYYKSVPAAYACSP
jgi:CRP-like cAMP-binding protein